MGTDSIVYFNVYNRAFHIDPRLALPSRPVTTLHAFYISPMELLH